MAHAIEVHGLTKRFGAVLAVDQLSFTADAGRVVGFLGPNGAGKTTTLRMLLGLVNPTQGTATVNGSRYVELGDPVHTVGAVLDGGMLHPGRSGRNHLRALAKAVGIADARVEELLELVALKDAGNRRAGGYSLGMRQRLGLAAALLGDPKVLVLDEPANGLDPQGIRWLRDFLRSLAADGRTILLSSHVLAEVAQTVDDVVVIDHGRLVTHQPLAQLLARTTEVSVRVRCSQPSTLAAALTAMGVSVDLDSSDALTVTGASTETIGQVAFDNAVVLHEISPVVTSLEETFLQMTTNSAEEATTW